MKTCKPSLMMAVLLMIFLLVLIPSAEADSCSFFALGPDGTNVGSPPLEIRLSSIKFTTSNLNLWDDGWVTFYWSIDGGGWQKYATVQMQGYAATAPATSITFDGPDSIGDHTVQLYCAHSSGSSKYSAIVPIKVLTVIGIDVNTLMVLLLIGVLVIFIIVASSRSKPSAPKVEAPKIRPKMRGLMQYGGETPGRVLSTKQPAPAPKMGLKKPLAPAYSAGEVHIGVHEIPASFPTAEGGHHIGGVGITVPPPTSPPVSNLRISRVRNSVKLDWEPPQYDTSKGKLIGYEVFRKEEVSWSTAWQERSLGTVGPDIHSFEVPHMERSGYYNVKPIYRILEGQQAGQIVFGPGFGG